MAILLLILVSGCGSYKDYRQYLKDYKEFQEYKAYKESLLIPETIADTITKPSDDSVSSNDITEPTVSLQGEPQTVSGSDLIKIADLLVERNEVYNWENSYEKTMKINELDRQILTLGNYDFSNITADFVGDSITEGVGGNVDSNGIKLSYVNYVQDLLRFKEVINMGKAGRMIASHNNPELSIEVNETSLINLNAQTIVIYAGINDFLCEDELKIYGELDSGSTSGYCGQLQSFTKSLENNYPEKDFFFVTSYQILTTDSSVYKDFEGTPTLNDYMEPQRILAERYGYRVIELYNTGFMSMNGKGNEYFFKDTIHPNIEGYRVLGEHIAAEILLYYLGF